jgi:hypothetical protein
VEIQVKEAPALVPKKDGRQSLTLCKSSSKM